VRGLDAWRTAIQLPTTLSVPNISLSTPFPLLLTSNNLRQCVLWLLWNPFQLACGTCSLQWQPASLLLIRHWASGSYYIIQPHSLIHNHGLCCLQFIFIATICKVESMRPSYDLINLPRQGPFYCILNLFPQRLSVPM
jgi:hypothetical protein